MDQLGGRSFIRMTGAKNLMTTENGICFRIPYPKVNAVRITLDDDDTYKVEFMRIRGTTIKEVSTHEGIYNTDLAPLFRDVTGLETRMPTVFFS